MDESFDKSRFFPIALEVNEGKTYQWCGCGKSLTQPLCDQSIPCKQSVEFVARLTEDVYFCNCKATKNPPWCDGSHGRLLLEVIKNKGGGCPVE